MSTFVLQVTYLISPGHLPLDEIHEAFDRIGLAHPDPQDLEPLRAA